MREGKSTVRIDMVTIAGRLLFILVVVFVMVIVCAWAGS